jgi:hypothetical protein
MRRGTVCLSPAGKLTDNEKIALRTFDKAMRADATLATVLEDNTECSVVRIDDWRRWFYREGKPGEAESTKRTAFKRATESLLARDRIRTRDDFVWPTPRTETTAQTAHGPSR